MSKRLGLALLAFILWTTITVVGGNITTGGEGSLVDAVSRQIGWTFVVASAFILGVTLWQKWRDVGLDRGASAGGWVLTWLPMLYIVGGLVTATIFGLPPLGLLAMILINTLLVGFSEELAFRGVVLQALRHVTSIWSAVVLTSVAFGAVHSLNVFVTGDLKAALIQSCAAFLSGIVFIALRLRTGSLWPSIIVHALWDFATFTLGVSVSTPGAAADAATPSGLTQFIPVLLVLPNAIYGLWLMRNIAKTHVDPEI
jgi:membrane protease YdiL (CAAX protease family)